MVEPTIREMAEHLSQIEDITWGMYAFSRDFLRDKVDGTEKKKMISNAIHCGLKRAEQVIKNMGTEDPWKLADKWKLKVEFADSGQIAGRVLLALFKPPDLIQIMKEPIERAAGNREFAGLITGDQIINLILGHEIFHFLEEEDEKIYTRNEKIVLWKLFGYENRSTIRALSEIAGMYFSKRINNVPYSPFVLDILLYYNYNPGEAFKMYKEVMSLKVEK